MISPLFFILVSMSTQYSITLFFILNRGLLYSSILLINTLEVPKKYLKGLL